MPYLDSLIKIIESKTFSVFSISVLFVLVFANLVGTNVLATKGFELSKVESQIMNLEKENRQLSVRIEEASNLSSIESLALASGFESVKNVVFVSTPATTALR